MISRMIIKCHIFSSLTGAVNQATNSGLMVIPENALNIQKIIVITIAIDTLEIIPYLTYFLVILDIIFPPLLWKLKLWIISPKHPFEKFLPIAIGTIF